MLEVCSSPIFCVSASFQKQCRVPYEFQGNVRKIPQKAVNLMTLETKLCALIYQTLTVLTQFSKQVEKSSSF